MTENTSSRLERTSKDSISFPFTCSNEFSASKNERSSSRIRFKPVRSDVLMRELLKEENSPKFENNTKNTNATVNNMYRETKEKSYDSICNDDESSTNILDKTLIDEDSVVNDTKDLMPGFAWLDKTPTNEPIKCENKIIDESPSNLFSKLLINDNQNANKIEKKQNENIYQGLSEYLFKTPSFKNYKILTTVAKNQCNNPNKILYTNSCNNDSIISSSNPQLLSAKKKTPCQTSEINKNPNDTNIILREKNMNVEQPVQKIETPKQITKIETKKVSIEKDYKPKNSLKEAPKNNIKVSGLQNKQIIPYPIQTPVASLPESTTFKTLKIRGKDYIIINKLGEGGSGQVYRCLEQDTLQDRAVKVVNLAVDAHTAASYINEVKMLKDLQGNDRVIKMYDYEQQNQNLFVVMEKGDVDFSEFLRNINAESQIQRHIIICYWVEMLKCVKEIHKNGIIHSDLKPSNFLLVGGRLKLIDFGIASKMSGDMTSVIKNEQVGTFNYISPEALLDSRECPTDGKPKIRISYKSDVWSLGCILYQMVYRKTPFHNITTWITKVATIIDKNHRIDYPIIERIPPQLIDIIKKCLTYDMKNRPSVEELLNMYYTGNY